MTSKWTEDLVRLGETSPYFYIGSPILPDGGTAPNGAGKFINGYFEGASVRRGNDYNWHIRLDVDLGSVATATTIEKIEVTVEYMRSYKGNLGEPGFSGAYEDKILIVEHSSIGHLGTLYDKANKAPFFTPYQSELVYTGNISNGIITLRGYLDERVNNDPGGGYLRYTSIKITGTGANPFAPAHDGSPFCPICYVANGQVLSFFPISLTDGEKREQVTDIELNTPGEALAFTRYYRQGKQAAYDLMGLGWTHNHAIRFEDVPNATPADGDKLRVILGNGGIASFTYDSLSGQFVGDTGANSVITMSGTPTVYTLTASDQSTFVFDDEGRLTSRTWPNNEVWTYCYDTNDRLVAVYDNEQSNCASPTGIRRALRFSYNSDGLLHRVGDQESDLTTPSGRYVEFSYLSEKSGGSPVNNGGYLLGSVQDVRGHTWTYDYYGQDSDEADTDLLNKLTRYLSPTVDQDGDGVADGSITLKDLTYTVDSDGDIATINQKVGGGVMETDFTFQGYQTLEETAGLTQTHKFSKGLLAQTLNAASEGGLQVTNGQYRPNSQSDANGNETQMNWRGDGKLLQGVTDAEGNETAFYYDSEDRLMLSRDAEGRHSLYAYADTGAPRQPSRIVVTGGDNLVANGDMETSGDWTTIGSDTTAVPSTTQFDSGAQSFHVTTNAAAKGMESNAIAVDEDKTYLVAARIYREHGDVKLAVDTASVIASGTVLGEWETLYAVYNPATSTNRNLQILAEGGAAEFYVDNVVFEVIERWQEFDYDGQGRTTEERLVDPTDGTTALQKTTRSYYTSGNGNGLLQRLTVMDVETPANDRKTDYTYDGTGRVVKTYRHSLLGTCQYTFTVYDEAGNVTVSACSTSDLDGDDDDVDTGDEVTEANIQTHYTNNPDATTVTKYVYDAMGRQTETIVDAFDTDYERRNLVIYDGLSRVIRTINNYVVQGASAPADWVYNTNSQRWEYSGSDATEVQHGDENNQNIVSRTEYNERGLVRLTQDVTGSVTLYGYNDADRLVKTIQNASQPGYNNYYTDALLPNPDPDLSAYGTLSTQPDEDVVTENAYDPAGNLVKTTDPLGQVTFTIYDALNRPVRVVRNAKTTATVELQTGDSGYDATNDPRSDSYVLSADADRDVITELMFRS